MIRVRGFEVLDSWHGVEAWRLGWIRVPLDLARSGLVSVEERALSRPRVIRHAWAHRRRSPMPIAPAIHVLSTPSGTRRFTGFLVGDNLPLLVEYLQRRCEPAPGSGLHAWLQRAGRTRLLQADLYAALSAAMVAIAGREELPAGGLPGVWPNRSTVPELVPVHAAGGVWQLARTDRALCLVAQRTVRIGGHPIPIEPFARLEEREQARTSWWDGARFGFANAWEEVPGELRSELERGGTSVTLESRESRPFADLEPTFLVRRPTLVEARKARPGPAPWPGAALLLPSTRPVALLTPDGAPRDLPAIASVPEALGLLCRAGTAEQCYLPSAPPCDPRDLALDSQASWLVGLAPFGGTA